jgi:hypothetical protein
MVVALTFHSIVRSPRTLAVALVALTTASMLLLAQIAAAQNYTVIGEVWNDANCDGIRQATEAAMPNIHVALTSQGIDQQLFTADDRQIELGQARTPDGQFSFTRGGPYGDLYAIVIYNGDKPAGFQPAPHQQGDDRTIDNDLHLPLESQGSPLWATTAFEMRADRSAVTDIDIGLAPTSGCAGQQPLPHPGHANDVFIPLLRR